MLRRLISICLVSLFFIFTAVAVCAAVEIDPNLLLAIQSAGPTGDVPVIINLSDKVDVPSFAAPLEHESKHSRRDKITRALKDKADLTQTPLKQFLQSMGAKGVTALWIQNAVAATIPSYVVGDLISFPGIESIKLDAVVQAPPIIPAAAATPEWNISAVRAPDLWSLGFTGTGVVVANLDTGVDVTHPDLQPRWRGGACPLPPNCPSWYDPYTNSTTPYDSAGTSTGHGTGTMGIMVGDSSGGTAIGVAPGAQWIAAKIFPDTGNALLSNIDLAFQWVLAPGGNTANTPDVVNNSWEFNAPGTPCDTTFQADIQTLKAAGIAVVFAAGNSGPNSSTSVSPANNSGSFAVGAIDNNDVAACFSSRGPSSCDGSIFPHVVAPGTLQCNSICSSCSGIRLAAPGGGYTSASGTSFSAPHVVGAMALLLSAFPNLTPAHLEKTLEETAAPLGGAVPNNTYGYGLIDLAAAYNALLPHAKKVGLYDPVTGTFYLRNSNTPGPADITFRYGPTSSTWIPIVGDWDGNGTTTVGLYDPVAGLFRLRNSNTPGLADIKFTYGPTNSTWIPIAGDWTGSGITTVGLYDPVGGTFHLRNSNSSGPDDITFRYGPTSSTWIPIVGDWTGSGITTVGLYDPVGGLFRLRNSNTPGLADIKFRYGPQNSTWIPIVGDWDGNGTTTVGLYDPVAGLFRLRNSNTPGLADLLFAISPSGAGWIPVCGDWNGLP